MFVRFGKSGVPRGSSPTKIKLFFHWEITGPLIIIAIVLQALSGEGHDSAGQGFAKVQIGDVSVFESLGEESFVVELNTHKSRYQMGQLRVIWETHSVS